MARIRFLRKKGTKEVFIWTEILSKRSDMEEVWALDAEDAARISAIPTDITPEAIMRMTRNQMLSLGASRGIILNRNPKLTLGQMQDVMLDFFGLEKPRYPVPNAANESSQDDGEDQLTGGDDGSSGHPPAVL